MIDNSLKQRLVGAIVLVSLAVIFIPMMLGDSDDVKLSIQGTNIPPEPDYSLKETDFKQYNNLVKPKPTDRKVTIVDVPTGARTSARTSTYTSAYKEPPSSEQSVILGMRGTVKRLESDKKATESENSHVLVINNKKDKVNVSVDMSDVSIEQSKSVQSSSDKIQSTNKQVENTQQSQLNSANSKKEIESEKKQVAAIGNPAELSKPSVQKAPKNSSNANQSSAAFNDNTIGVVNKKVGVIAWAVQIGSFSNKASALTERDKLRIKGFASFVEEVKGEKGIKYRVRVGPELKRASADKLQERLAQETHSQGFVVQFP